MSIDVLRAAVEASIESISNRRAGGGTRAQAEATDAAWDALDQVGRDAARYRWLRSKFARGDLDYTHFATDEQVESLRRPEHGR